MSGATSLRDSLPTPAQVRQLPCFHQATIGPDYIELGSYICAAAVTRGELSVTGYRDSFGSWRILESMLKKLGVVYAAGPETLHINAAKALRIQKDVGQAIPKIEDGIWLEGREFRRAPDGHVLISLKGYQQWVEQGRG